MSTEFLILFFLFWIVFFTCRRFVNFILSSILVHLVKKIFPQENLQISVEDFGYFCANRVSVRRDKNKIVRVEKIVVEVLWEEFRLKLQSTLKDITLETCHVEGFTKKCENSTNDDRVVIRGSITIGINLYSFSPPTELWSFAPETEHVHGSEIKVSQLTSLWLFAQNATASIKGKVDGEEVVFFDLSISQGDALVLYNSNMARLVFLFQNANAMFCPYIHRNDEVNSEQVATSEGLVLIYKFEDGLLTSSRSRLRHTEVNLTSSIVSNLENLVAKFVNENKEIISEKGNYLQNSEKNDEVGNGEILTANNEQVCEVAMEAESITINVHSSDSSRHFELKLGFISLGSPEKNTVHWNITIPFEVMFINKLTGKNRQSVFGSKIKSEGLVNPCVLKIKGDKISNWEAKWNISFHEGILIEIKPDYVNTLEDFFKAYKSRTISESSSETEEQTSEESEEDNDLVKCSKKAMCEITASIYDIMIDVKDSHDEKLLQVIMVHPQFSLSQGEEMRNLSFKIETLQAFNCVENIPFFHPTAGPGNEKSALELSIVEKLLSADNKLSFEKFSFGSCDTTVMVGETLLFAIMKDFGLHKKVTQIFFESPEDKSKKKSNKPSKRLYFDSIELRAVEVILTLLPAIELPVELQVIKNELGIPHQLPPRVENACLYFDAFVRNTIQYGSYKYISYDIKKHYLKELGSQSARVLGSMHLLGNISRLKQDIMSGFTTLRETGEFITFFRQVTTGVASSYSKFTGSWSDLFGLSSPVLETRSIRKRRYSDPSDLDVAVLRQLSGECAETFESPNESNSKDDCAFVDLDETSSESIWLRPSLPSDTTDGLIWDMESSDGDGGLGMTLDLIPRNVQRQLKGQEFLRRLKENIGDNEHGEVFACCLKVRKDEGDTKLNALLSNRKVYFLTGRPSHESLVLCVKYETLYKAQYTFQDKTHYVHLMSKMKGIKTLSIPSRKPSESPLVRCDNFPIARKVSSKINELKRSYDNEYMHSQHQ